MATTTFKSTGNTWNTAGDWSGESVPTNADDVIFDASSGDCTLDVNGVGLTLDMSAYTGTLSMGTNNLDIDGLTHVGGTITNSAGAQIYCAYNFVITQYMSLSSNFELVMDGTANDGPVIVTAGVVLGTVTIAATATTIGLSGSLSCSSLDIQSGTFDPSGETIVMAGDFDITGGTLELNAAAAIWCAAFNLDGGIITGNSETLTINGDVLYAAGGGTASNVYMTLIGTANTLGWDVFAQRMLSCTISGSYTLIDDVDTKEIHITGSLAGAFEVTISPSTANDYLEVTGTVAAATTIAVSSANSITNQYDVNGISGTLEYRGAVNNIVLTQSGSLQVPGDLWINHTTVLKTSTVLVNENSTLGDCVLGSKTISGSGIVTFGDGFIHTIGSIAAGNAANTADAMTVVNDTTITDAFDTSNIVTVNLDGIITVPSITAESTATNNTTLTLTDDTTLIGNLVVNESAGVTTLNTNSKEFTVKGNVTGADTPVITALTLRSIGITNVIEWPATVSPITELLIGRGTEITSTGGINATKITPHTATKAASKGGWIAR